MWVKMLPVCPVCSHIFKHLQITKDPMNEYLSAYEIDPPTCPVCGSVIEGVKYEMPKSNGSFVVNADER